MLNFRLSDSLPRAVAEELLARFPHSEADPRKRAEGYLDAGYGACYLRDPAIASMVENALLYFDGECYRVIA